MWRCVGLAEVSYDMPLIALPEDNTKRYKLLYAVAGQQHTITSRSSSAQNDATAVGHMNAIVAAIASLCSSDTTFLDVLVALQGSNVFNSVGGLTITSGGGGAISTVNKPRAICFPGRTSNGRKTKAFLYGIDDSYATPGTYEEDPLTTPALQGFQGLLNSQSDFWLGIDGVKPTWYFRCTIKPNDHYVDAAR